MSGVAGGYSLKITDRERRDWGLFFRNLAAMIPCKKPDIEMDEHAEANRVFPSGSRFQGRLNLDITPYLREPMNNMSPMSPIQHTGIMKAAQGGFTMGCVECPICYYIGRAPADQLLLTATERLIKRWASRRMEPAIDSYDYRRLIFSQSSRPANKQTGDTIYSKEYPGGQLDMGSARSASNMRSTDKKILYRDEISAAKKELDTGEGDWLEVSEARTFIWGTSRKIMDISTPTIDKQCAIQKVHGLGDQRVWMVPCPHCLKFQIMKLRGFHVDTTAGKLNDIYYVCEHCHETVWEHHKLFFLPRGKWEPTEKAEEPFTRTYHWAAWNAPLGALTWKQIYLKYQKAQKSGEPDAMKSFVNLYLGLPYRDTGSRPAVEKVIELQGSYTAGTVPDGVLFLTMAVDVQQGSKTDKKNPPRLEFEILGHGAGYRTWSIWYERLDGAVNIANAGAWEDLNEYARKTGLTYKRKDGFEFPVELVFVDSGDGTMTDVIYKFTESWTNTYPISGFKKLTRRKKEAGDEMTADNLKRFRLVNNNGVLLYQISTNHYKHALYSNLKIPRSDFYPQPPQFCDFPGEYKEHYFKMLVAEEKRVDGSFSDGGRRNEALDCRVYNMCAGDVYLARRVAHLREKYKKQYRHDELLAVINHQYVLKRLSKEVGVVYE